jgi:hypothetical protein
MSGNQKDIPCSSTLHDISFSLQGTTGSSVEPLVPNMSASCLIQYQTSYYSPSAGKRPRDAYTVTSPRNLRQCHGHEAASTLTLVGGESMRLSACDWSVPNNDEPGSGSDGGWRVQALERLSMIERLARLEALAQIVHRREEHVRVEHRRVQDERREQDEQAVVAARQIAE